jgi:hypothetical protein
VFHSITGDLLSRENFEFVVAKIPTIGSNLPLIDVPEFVPSIARSAFSNCRCIKHVEFGIDSEKANSSGIYFYSGMTRIIIQHGLQPIQFKNSDPSMIGYELAERFSGLVDK